METVNVAPAFHVDVGVYGSLEARERSGKCSGDGRMKPWRLPIRGSRRDVHFHYAKSTAGPCSTLSSSVANASYYCNPRVVSSSKHGYSDSNSDGMSSAGRERVFLSNELYAKRILEDLQQTTRKSGSWSRASRRTSSRRLSAAGSLLVKSCAAVAGEGDFVVGDEVDESKVEGGLYRPFADFAVQELGRRSDVSPLLLKDEFRNMIARDGSTVIENRAFASSKIRYFRSTYINAGPSMQVLNVAGFSRPEYDIPIFCADFFSTSAKNIIVLDLNPLYSTSTDNLYKERYYGNLMALANKHAKVLPWGDKLTAESMQFFSPLVLWTKAHGQDLSKTLYPAFQDYLLAWLNISDNAHPSADPLATAKNQDAQHRYLIWRATKDPGRALLARLYGEELSERFIEEYLFQGVKTLGSKSFLDYFPDYRTDDNTISKQRSMIGKSFATRPWDEHGNLCLN